MIHLIIASLLCVASTRADTHVVWQGFSHKWERASLLFNTPHPLGSIQNRIVEEAKDPSSSKRKASAQFTFAPGLRGDYSHPQAYYSGVQVKDGTGLEIEDMDIQLNFTDLMNYTGSQANQTMRKTFRVQNKGDLRFSEIVLNGYDIQIKCADHEEYFDDTIWPLHLQMMVEKVLLPDDQPQEEGSFLYAVTVIIERGQVPSTSICNHTHYAVTVPLKVFYFTKGVQADVEHQTYVTEGDITDKNTQYSVHVAKFNKSFPATSAIVGLNNFGFQLEWDPKNTNRGRYVQKFESFIKTVSFNANEKMAYIGFQRGLLAPGWFASPENAKFTIGITTIAIAGPTEPKVSTVRNTQGKICVDDWKSLFWCSSEGMAAKTSDFVAIEVGDSDLFKQTVSDAPFFELFRRHHNRAPLSFLQ